MHGEAFGVKVLLVRGPRYYLPYITSEDNYLLPQGLACLAAALRAEGHQVRVLDCMPQKIGWGTLANILRQEAPEVVGVGDSETYYCYDAAKVLVLAKTLNPRTITLAGGGHFSHWIEEALHRYPIDFIVRGEGEVTTVKLLEALAGGSQDFDAIPGLAFLRDREVVLTPPPPLIRDLDQLPMPAYDLMPMSDYPRGKVSSFDPSGITIHHSRGCAADCDFCACWIQMAEEKWQNGKLVKRARWRTKSVERTVEEMEWLYNRFQVRGLVFVDDTWNSWSRFSNDFAEEVLRRGLKMEWFAFMRADLLLKEEKLGILEKLVRAGLRHLCIGIERPSSEQLQNLNKGFYTTDLVMECLHLLKERYPQVYRQGTFIVGTREESRESMFQLLEYAKKLDLDYAALHPMTPVPGTRPYQEAVREGWLEIEDFSYFDWSTPVISTKHLSREEVEELMTEVILKFYRRPSFWLKGLLSRHSYRRTRYLGLLLGFLRFYADLFREQVGFPHSYAESRTHLVEGRLQPGFYYD